MKKIYQTSIVRLAAVASIIGGTCCLMTACGPSEKDEDASLRLPDEEEEFTPVRPRKRNKPAEESQTFAEARKAHTTRLVEKENIGDPAPEPPPNLFELTQYESPLGPMACYVGNDPTPDKATKHPAIIWRVGGFANSISESAWEGGPRDNDQSATTFREAGIVMMYPSLRGGTDNPGHLEGLFGEVDDLLAAADHLATLDYVDPDRIYLGGHSVGGTLVLLAAAAAPEKFRAVFSFGPVEDTSFYGQENIPFDVDDSDEARLRAPIHWLHGIRSPTFVFEGEDGNVDSLEVLKDFSHNPQIHFYPVADADHFSVIRPVSELIADKILADSDADSKLTISSSEVAERIAHFHAPPRPPFPAGNPASDAVSLEFGIYFTPKPKGEISPVELAKKLIDEDFPELNWVDQIPDETGGDWATAFLYEDVSDGYAPPSVDSMRYFARGINTQQASDLQTSEQALILLFEHPQAKALPNLRAANRLVHRIAAATEGYPWDEETRRVFSLEAWKGMRVDSWTDEVPEVALQTTYHAYRDGDYVRAITLGMSKFGLPDVVVDQFAWSESKPMGSLLNSMCQLLVEGAEIGPQGSYQLDIKNIGHEAVRESFVESLIGDGTGTADLHLKRGAWESGDPENSLVEISFETAEGPDLFARQNKLLSGLFGYEDRVTHVDHDEALEKASALARKKLPGLQNDFQAGLEPGEIILVKAPFDVPDVEDGREWMWVEISKWDGDDITGILKSEPYQIPSLHAGQQVEVNADDIFDYIRRQPNGESEGNTTGEIIRKMQENSDNDQ